jgi:beta-lactamase class A
LLAACLLGSAAWAGDAFGAAIARMEARLKGRIGVCALRGDQVLAHRGDERFAYCSTFKWVLGAAILKQVDAGSLRLETAVAFSERDLIEPSPVTGTHVKAGHMSIGELCAATIMTSDNTAANLLEPMVGGRAGMQSFVKDLGDPVMRFDRLEPELNSNLPGDPRDTTSPQAMATLLRSVLETNALTPASRGHLIGWMKAATTGLKRIRAGVPKTWGVAHKTGTSGNGACNDIALVTPPNGTPIYLCIFTDIPKAQDATREATIAEVTRIARRHLR